MLGSSYIINRFKQTGKVLKLKRSLYGLKNYSRYFTAFSFKSAIDIDSCLFIPEGVTCFVYADHTPHGVKKRKISSLDFRCAHLKKQVDWSNNAYSNIADQVHRRSHEN